LDGKAPCTEKMLGFKNSSDGKIPSIEKMLGFKI
jgi:hypothetical protein